MNNQMHRDYCIDALKMLLIVLVIYGHIPLLDGLINVLNAIQLLGQQ